MGAISANPEMKNQNYLCISVKTKQIDMRTADNEAHPLDGNDDKGPQAVCYAIDQQGGKNNAGYAKDVMVTLCSDSHGTPHAVCYSSPAAFMGGQGAKARSIAYCDDGTTPTLKAVLSGTNNVPDVVYPINLMVATRGGRDDMRTCFGIGEVYLIDQNQTDARYTMNRDGVCQTVTARFGTGGGSRTDGDSD